MGLRQYLPKKAHKCGIKVWAHCGVSGIVYDFQVYTGANSGTTAGCELNLGVGGNVVKHLVSSLQRNVGHKIYFNYFASVDLVKYLEEGIWAVGTIRADRLKGAKKNLKDKKALRCQQQYNHCALDG